MTSSQFLWYCYNKYTISPCLFLQERLLRLQMLPFLFPKSMLHRKYEISQTDGGVLDHTIYPILILNILQYKAFVENVSHLELSHVLCSSWNGETFDGKECKQLKQVYKIRF